MFTELGAWCITRDGDPNAAKLYERHYSCINPNRQSDLIAGVGEKIVAVTVNYSALFIWRKQMTRDDGQHGIECAVFRNESQLLSSRLILEAEQLALAKWPDCQRFFSYIDPVKVSSQMPGYCFIRAKWKYVKQPGGELYRSKKSNLLLIEKRLRSKQDGRSI